MNIPGFYAESHLRVQKSCSWFPIGHLPSYGESAHEIRLFFVPGDKRIKPLFLEVFTCDLAYSMGKKWGVFNVEEKGGTTTSAAQQPHTPHKLRTKIPPESLPISWPLFQLKRIKTSVYRLQGL